MKRLKSSKKASKRVLAICGSHRKGNTNMMLDALLKEVSPAYEKTIIDLRDLDVQRCTGDDYCVDHKRCHINDDFKMLALKMEAADLIIFASPSYFNNVTALMKNFIDRCNVLYNNEALKGRGKKAVLCAIGCEKMKHIRGCITALRNLCRGIYVDVMAELIIENNNIIAGTKEIKDIGEKINEDR